jgi:prolyl-tRNA editing enzyme YbaK/EbsC (Cys-tRNA(Pro) deacylase)
MPVISKIKKDKIAEQILHYLFSIAPESKFTAEISAEIARDEEFVKSILSDLQKKELIVAITKNKSGISYMKRQRWRLANQAFDVYTKAQAQQARQSIHHNNNIYNDSDL